VYFPKNKEKHQNINAERVLIDYLKGKTYKKIAEEIGTNVMRICRIVKDERGLLSAKRVKFWRDKGLVYRELSRLYKMTHEAIRQIEKGDRNE